MKLVKNMTATKLRLILASTLFVTTIIGAAIAYFANSMLSQVATDVSHTVADAEASYDSLQSLQQTERDLEENQEVVKRASEVVANSQNYQYQNQIINDLNQYASRSGIEVTNIDFSSDTKTPGTTTPPTTGSGTAAPTAPAPAGVQTATITVTLKNPVDYNNLLRFIQSIEQNLTKMQLASVSITKDQAGVSSDVLSIKVYVR